MGNTSFKTISKMPGPHQLPDDAFEDLLEELYLQNKTAVQIQRETKSSQARINKLTQNVQRRWEENSSINTSRNASLAKIEAQCDYIGRLALESFFKSRKRFKQIYRNDVTNPSQRIIENHRITESGPGDPQWLRVALSTVQYKALLAKVDKIDPRIDDDFDVEEYMEFKAWKIAKNERILDDLDRKFQSSNEIDSTVEEG